MTQVCTSWLCHKRLRDGLGRNQHRRVRGPGGIVVWQICPHRGGPNRYQRMAADDAQSRGCAVRVRRLQPANCSGRMKKTGMQPRSHESSAERRIGPLCAHRTAVALRRNQRKSGTRANVGEGLALHHAKSEMARGFEFHGITSPAAQDRRRSAAASATAPEMAARAPSRTCSSNYFFGRYRRCAAAAGEPPPRR